MWGKQLRAFSPPLMLEPRMVCPGQGRDRAPVMVEEMFSMVPSTGKPPVYGNREAGCLPLASPGHAVENSQQLCFLSAHVIGVHHCIDRCSRSLGSVLIPGMI